MQSKDEESELQEWIIITNNNIKIISVDDRILQGNWMVWILFVWRSAKI